MNGPRMLEGIRAVVFDAVGTIIHPDPPAADVYVATARRFGVTLDPATARRRFENAFRLEDALDRTRGWQTDAEREERRWRAVVQHVLGDMLDAEACFRELWDHFAKQAPRRLAAETAASLTQLRSARFGVGVASNFDSRLRSVLAGVPQLPADLPIVISAEIGWRKPAPEFFTAVASALDLSPSAVLMVGDDAETDVAAAQRAGMPAVLIGDFLASSEISIIR